MRGLIISGFSVLAGVALGWWLHGHLSPVEPLARSVTSAGAAGPLANSTPEFAGFQPFEEVDSSLEPDSAATVRRFRHLLELQDFDAALLYYEQAENRDEAPETRLKPVLENYLKACMTQCGEGVFISAVDTWLASYYEDIPVLLLLAEYQQREGFPEEAARVLHTAMTYAYQPNQRERANMALRRLVQSTDANWSEQQRWVELIGFFELLEAIGISEPYYLLRQAMIYQLLKEPGRAQDLLLALRAGDDGLDPKWTEALELQLAGIAPQPQREMRAGDAVALIRRGDHYLIETAFNNTQEVVLMIDTGASMTSLSRASFAGLSTGSFELRGSQMFNTANGVTRGDVYRAGSISLGHAQLEEVDVAVLDYESPDGVDGLLGMNVLRNYRFEIDQDEAVLYLRPR